MDNITGALLISLVALLIWAVYNNTKKETAGFQNNDYYFQGNENDSMYVGRLIMPKLIHKINIPEEW